MGNNDSVRELCKKNLENATPVQHAKLATAGVFGWACIGYTVYRIVRGIVKITKK